MRPHNQPVPGCTWRRRRQPAAALAVALLVAWCMPVAGAAAAPGATPGPRLLLVEKNGRMALFLPETHIGSPEQDDAYFRRVIQPAFAASTELLAEHSIGPWFDRTYDDAACPDEGTAEAALDDALNDAVREQALATPAMLASIAMQASARTPGRFIRFYRLFSAVHQRDGGREPVRTGAGGRAVQMRNAQSGVLLAGAPRRATTVEDTGTFLRAYCALSATQRAALIAATIEQSKEQPDRIQPAEPVATLLADSYRSIAADYLEALSCMRAMLPTAHVAAPGCRQGDAAARSAAALAMNRYTLVERSAAWVDGLPDVMRRDRLPFYALGAAHFPDGPAGPGLVTLLRHAGYHVSLLTSRHALDAALARLPRMQAAPPEVAAAMHTLAGGCRHDGASYACEWRDATVSYLVLNPQRAERQEYWSACFERIGLTGPEKHCVAAQRQAGSERDADLAWASMAPVPAPP